MTTPSGTTLSVTDVTATIKQYGNFVRLSDVVQFNSIDPVLQEAAEVLGENAGETLDELARDVLTAGTTVQYSNESGTNPDARGSVGASDILSATEIKKAVRTLQTNKAKKITRIVNPDTGYNTSPINAAYIGIVGPKGLYDLKGATGWVPIEKYANKADVIDGEAGALDEVRFILSEKSKVWTGAGSGSIDVHATLILGANAYGVSRISGEAIKNIVKPLGSAGSADPLDQRATSGWKATFVTKILNESAMLRLEHAVSS